MRETRNESHSVRPSEWSGVLDDEEGIDLYLFMILSSSVLPLCILVRKYSSLSCCVMVLFHGNFDMSHLSFRKSITAINLNFITQEVSSTL